MRPNKILSIAFIALLLFLSFSKAPRAIAIDGFNAARWQKDISGCQSVRVYQAEKLLKNKSLLLKRPKKDILALLGTPDITQGNKYYWCLDYGDQCHLGKGVTTAPKLKDVSLVEVVFDGKERTAEVKLVEM